MSISEGRVGRVRQVDGDRVYVNLPGGNLAWFDTQDADDWVRGQVIVLPHAGHPEPASDDLWVTGTDTAVVRAVTEDVALIEIDGKIRSFIQSQAEPWETGQTIALNEDGSPGRAITDRPVDRFGLGAEREFDVETLLAGTDSTVTLNDFGGNRRLVRRAINLVDAALDRDGRFRSIGAKPIKGVLFSGPAGTGKTFLAQGLANHAGAHFYNIGGPELVDQYVGQSEKRLRDVFEHAYESAPSILFFDELDSMFSQRADDTPDYANRLVGQFLSLLDGFRTQQQVMVIATTNLRGRLDRALLRPGRFGHELTFDLPDQETRSAILFASSRKIEFSEDVELNRLAEDTAGWSSADLASIWTEAALNAHADGRASICAEDAWASFEAIKAQRAKQTSLALDMEASGE